jgi:hypothetical protein
MRTSSLSWLSSSRLVPVPEGQWQMGSDADVQGGRQLGAV